MSVTGLLLVGFLLAHLSGNLLVFAGEEAINLYAKTLRDYLPILWLLRIGLIVMAVLHIFSGVKLTRMNSKAKPVKYKVKQSVKASFASRYMGLTGLVVLAFIAYHLAHLTFRFTHPAFQSLGDYDVYKMLMLSFSNPVLAIGYCICVILLMVHLSHGVSSLFQTLGINHKKYNGLIRSIGPALSTLLAIGYLSIPLSILLGFIK
ncbi:MAG: succinate dehydrogenase cytochrome b subunit [Oligoflexales bacterium]|nr:succinate dehydrogenase cytochrome b subunit [Oligoflexales bacterium]